MDGLLRLMAELQETACNPELRAWQGAQPNNVAGKGRIEKPGEARNIVWQNRATAPGEYENALGDALEKILGGGAETLEQIVAGLIVANFRAPDGSAWTETSFAAELHRLGA